MKNERVAIYCRLSREDERQGESESIQNQKALLTKYASEKGWDIVGTYADDNFSGADRQRPDFCRLLRDAKSGYFDVVLVKTQSRFTRDMEIVEKYIHNRFPLWGIRFVAAVEGVDTCLPGNKKARQINGLVNEWYLEDLSENIRAVLDVKRHEGQFIGSFPAYGYRKDPQDHHRLLIDEPAAQTVREIFRLCLLGMGKQKIAEYLNAREIPNPTAYKRAQGLAYVNGGEYVGDGKWSRTSVGRILHSAIYLGDLVQGVRRKTSYKSKAMISVPREQWVIVSHTHAPIISQEMFSAVQTLLKQRTRAGGTGQVHRLAGKVFCMTCGSPMSKYSHLYQGKRREYLRCGARESCVSHTIRLDALESAIWNALSIHLSFYGLESFHVPHSAAGTQEKRVRQMTALQREMEKRDKALQTLYLDKAEGLISAEQFSKWSTAYQAEKEEYQAQYALLEQQSTHDDTDKQCISQLTRGLVLAMIRSVEIGQRDGGKQVVRIYWNF